MRRNRSHFLPFLFILKSDLFSYQQRLRGGRIIYYLSFRCIDLCEQLNKLGRKHVALRELLKYDYIRFVRYIPTIYENFKLYRNEIYTNGKEEVYKCIFQLALQSCKEGYSLVS